MVRVAWIALTALMAVVPASVSAAAGGFTLVNATGAGLKSVSIRRFGTQEWRPLADASAPGARAAIDFADPDCAFDIRATLDGGATAQWSRVNLCEVKAVILSRNEAGATWVDYD